MKRSNYNYKVYNLLLPIWLIVFLPSPLWLILIPANYLIDRIVLRWSLGDMPEKGLFCRNHTWKICLAGFAGDFAGAMMLFAINQLVYGVNDDVDSYIDKVADAIMYNPFSNIPALIIVIAAIILSAVCIYNLDKGILTKAGLEIKQAKKAAIRLAVITAPYLYLIPSELFYD